MGGYGSGRTGGRPTVDASKRIDLAWMLRKGLAKEGAETSGTLTWQCGGSPAGSISYTANMFDPDYSRLALTYTRRDGDWSEDVEQTIRLTHTVPNFGGRRWWMICPYSQSRVGKLYMPPGGDRFASRKAWGLGYQSQRLSAHDRPFEALYRLHRKLGCERGWEMPISRPKGMWHRTFERLEDEYWYLDGLCAVEMMRKIGFLAGKL